MTVTIRDLIALLSAAKNQDACIGIRTQGIADSNCDGVDDETVVEGDTESVFGDAPGMLYLIVAPGSDLAQAALGPAEDSV